MPETDAADANRPSRVRVPLLAFVGCVVYGAMAAVVFCFSGAFGTFGDSPWRDAALVIVTGISALALTYVSLLVVTYVRRRPSRSGDLEDLSWHVMIPCRDEESVIAETVSAARSSFPGMHVWVIDDASEDATATIVTGLSDFDDKVHLISRRRPHARTGKGDALNSAYRVIADWVAEHSTDCRRTIIGVLDADGFLSDNALDLLAGPDAFGDESVGAVQLEVWMKNRDDKRPRPTSGRLVNWLGRVLVRLQDIEFRTSNSAMQMLRVQTGTVGMGGNGQFTRLSVLADLDDAFGQPWGQKLCEDYELGLNILARGHRTHYIPDAHVSQEALPFGRRLLTQRTRWSQGNLECASNLRDLRRSSHVQGAGLAEIHYFMAQPWLIMINLLLGPALLVHAVVTGNAGFAAGEPLEWMILLAAVFIVLPYALWGLVYRRSCEPGLGGGQAVFLGACYLIYVYLTYLYYPRAMARMLTGRTGWAKTLRNADAVDLGPIPAVPAGLLAHPLVSATVVDDLAVELGGDRESSREVLGMFAVVWPRRWANLRLAVSAEDEVAIRDALGSIRVSSDMLGAERLAQCARDVEVVLEGGDHAEADQSMKMLHRVGEETVEAVRGIVIPR
ncbi:glycosyltransferase [Nesterenkonia sp. CL21]|uniref:glycosyltransferase n=1 Tax=Nesterenkonia sp. CL21 TaxID=3064894 RepID=UPI0028790355|nr:glycosyltransferase [Nesterenkonia sp. CL21]MDS2174048.1 glycosyltransferase [Nesterenkonia sp. CL21]